MSEEINNVLRNWLIHKTGVRPGRDADCMADDLRNALHDAGYSIQFDESALLQKGRDAGVVLSEPPLPTLR